MVSGDVVELFISQFGKKQKQSLSTSISENNKKIVVLSKLQFESHNPLCFVLCFSTIVHRQQQGPILKTYQDMRNDR